MSLLSGFAGGAAKGVSEKWADNREAAMLEAKTALAERLQDRGVSLRAGERATQKAENLADYNDPNSLASLQGKAAAQAGELDHQRKIELEGLKASGKAKGKKPTIKTIKKTLAGQDEEGMGGTEVELFIDVDSGRYLDSGNYTEAMLSQSEAEQQAEAEASDKLAFYESENKEKFGGSKAAWVAQRAGEIRHASIPAVQWGIDPARFVKSFGDNQLGGLLNQPAPAAGDSTGTQAVVMPGGFDQPGPAEAEAMPGAPAMSDKEAEALLAQSGIKQGDSAYTRKRENFGRRGVAFENAGQSLLNAGIGIGDGLLSAGSKVASTVAGELAKPNKFDQRRDKTEQLAAKRFLAGVGSVEGAEAVIASKDATAKQKTLARAFLQLNQ